jgi:[acyl-carrier-protein] S-malonyltransferase
MGRGLYDGFEAGRSLMDRARDLLGFDITRLMFEGPQEDLTETQNAQPALFIVGVATFLLLKENGFEMNLAFGHSLGEFTALHAAGVFPFDEGLSLVRKRGELMSRAGAKYPGGMAAVIGLDREKLEEVIGNAGGTVVMANVNSPDQVVISGDKESVLRAAELAKEAGAKRAIPLNVSAAFHSPLMEEPALEFGRILESAEFREPFCPVIPNVTAKLTKDTEEIRTALMKQLRNPVLFSDSLREAERFGAGYFVEAGPGKVLSGLVRRTLQDVRTANVEGHDGIERLRESYDEG